MKKIIYALFFVFLGASCVGDEPEKNTDPLDIEMVFVEGGEYDKSAYPDMYPVTKSDKVQLNSFRIGKYEITQAQWEAVMGYNPSSILGESLPVNNVTWSDVRVFIKRLNSLTGKRYRLPSVAEWEFAARGGNQSKKFRYSGGDNALDLAWCGENSGYLMHPVGSKQPNELGIFDMCGNVSEIIPLPPVDRDLVISMNWKLFKGQNFSESADYLSLNITKPINLFFGSKYIGFRLILDSDQNSGDDDVRVVTDDVVILKDRPWGESLVFKATIYNRENASECGFMVGTDINRMRKYELLDVTEKYGYEILAKEYENSVIYYCAYAIDGWDLVKGEVKTFNMGK